MDIGFSLPQSKVAFNGLDSCCAFVCNSRNVLKARCGRELRVSTLKLNLLCRSSKLFRGNRGVWLKCQGNDSFAYDNGNGRNVDNLKGLNEESNLGSISGAESGEPLGEVGGQVEVDVQSVDELKELLQKALKELEAARVNSIVFEEKVKKISETAISLQDEASRAWTDVNSTLDIIQEIVSEEFIVKEAVQNATMALSLAEARLQVAVESLEVVNEDYNSVRGSNESDGGKGVGQEDKERVVAREDIKDCQTNLACCEAELRRLQSRKEELQNEVNKLHEIAEKAQLTAVKAEEDVNDIMHLAEQAVALELEAAKRVNDAEIAFQKANKSFVSVNSDTTDTLPVEDVVALPEEEKLVQHFSGDAAVKGELDLSSNDESLLAAESLETQSNKTSQTLEETTESDYLSDLDNEQLSLDSSKEAELEVEKSKNVVQTKKQETQKESTRDNSPSSPKSSLKKSSRFFPASFFSSSTDEFDYSLASAFNDLVESAQKQLPKLIVGLLLVGAGLTFYANRADRSSQLLRQPEVVATTVEEVSSSARPLVRQLQELPNRIKKVIASIPEQEVSDEEASLFDMLWLLLASVIFVPLFQRIPGVLFLVTWQLES